MSFKDSTIMNAEAVINSKRKKKEELYAEIEFIESEEQEARAILHLLKGKPLPDPKSNKITSHQEYMEAIRAILDEKPDFDNSDLSDLLGVSRPAASQKIKNLLADGTLVVAYERGPRIPSRRVKLA